MSSSQGFTLRSPIMIRKSIHFAIGMLILLLTWWVSREVLLWLIVGGTVFSFATFRYRKFSVIHQSGHASLGTLFYPLGVLGSYLMLMDYPVYFFQTVLMILTISDTAANLIGQIRSHNGWFVVLHDRKSMHGIFGFIVATLAVIFVFLPLSYLSDPFFLLLLLILSVLLEVISWRGSDNLSIPLGLAIFFVLTQNSSLDYMGLSAILPLMTLGWYLMLRFKALSPLGSFAAWLLGVYLLIMGSWQWISLVLLFFITSVGLTRLRATKKENKSEEGGRNAWQVAANILWAVIASILYLFTHDEIFIHLFIVFVAAVTADTWASEIGPMMHRRSFSLSDLRMHNSGVNGGVSPGGTLAAAAGALLISFAGYWIFFGYFRWDVVLAMALSGFAACFADSLLGAFAENHMIKWPLFRNTQGPERVTPNDLVNLGGSLVAGPVYLLMANLL